MTTDIPAADPDDRVQITYESVAHHADERTVTITVESATAEELEGIERGNGMYRRLIATAEGALKSRKPTQDTTIGSVRSIVLSAQ